jgi:putative peptidoglycan lipid II flippase
VFTAAIGTVMFPRMSRCSSEGNREELDRIFINALKTITVVTIPMSILLFAFGEPVISILFLRGAYDKGSMNLTLALLQGYSLGILGQSIVYISLKYYLSIKKVLKPFLIMASAGMINLLFDSYFIKRIGIGALGYGSAISATFSAFTMIICADINIMERFSKRLSLIYRVVAANLPIVIILVTAVSIWQRHVVQISFVSRALYGFAIFIICLLTYTVLLIKLGIVEMSNLGRGKGNVKGAANNTSL